MIFLIIIVLLVIYIFHISSQLKKLNEFAVFYGLLFWTTLSEKELRKAVLALFVYTASSDHSTLDHGQFWQNVCKNLGIQFSDKDYGTDMRNVEYIASQLITRQKLIKVSDAGMWQYQKLSTQQLVTQLHGDDLET